MGESPLSLHLDSGAMAQLEHEARQRDVPVNDLARDVIERYLEIQSIEREIIAARIEEADKGVFISGEAMSRWVESWGTDHELPPPEPDIFPPERE